MAIEMGFDLAFGFGEKAEVPFVAQQPGDDADAECAAKPQRIQQAFAAAEFVDARLAPGEVVGFFAGARLFQGQTDPGRGSESILSLACASSRS